MCVKSGVQLLCVLKQQLETRRSFLPGSCIKEQPFQSIYRRIEKQFSVVICDTCGTMIGFKAVVMSPNHSHFLLGQVPHLVVYNKSQMHFWVWGGAFQTYCSVTCWREGESCLSPTLLAVWLSLRLTLWACRAGLVWYVWLQHSWLVDSYRQERRICPTHKAFLWFDSIFFLRNILPQSHTALAVCVHNYHAVFLFCRTS